MRHALKLAAIGALACTLPRADAEAGPRGGGYYDEAYITVSSRYDPNQSVSAPVRRKANGRAEVKLPRGPWVDCGASCYSTLRVWVFDFWEISERGRFP
jgi:hypothetical protein